MKINEENPKKKTKSEIQINWPSQTIDVSSKSRADVDLTKKPKPKFKDSLDLCKQTLNMIYFNC